MSFYCTVLSDYGSLINMCNLSFSYHQMQVWFLFTLAGVIFPTEAWLKPSWKCRIQNPPILHCQMTQRSKFGSKTCKGPGSPELWTMGGFICTFSLLISLSITLRTSKFRNQFTISSKYFDMVCYFKWETYSGLISFEVQRNDIWTDNIQSFEMPF